MILRKRYYDGYGNELRIDEVKTGIVKVQINESSIELPLMKLFDLMKESGTASGKHVKLEIR